MAAYADYEFYSQTFLGTAIAQADFPRLALRASFFVDQVTFNRAAPVVEEGTDAATIEKIAMSTCSVAEELQQLDASGGAVQSESVGRHSVTYVAPLAEHTRLCNAAKLYLWSTDLMYRGLNADE